MSLYIALRKPDAAYLLSDAAIYDDAGTLVKIQSKIAVLDNMSAALTMRGPLGALEVFMLGINGTGDSFDGLVENFDVALEASKPVFEKLFGAEAPLFDMVLVGWSESRDRPELYYASGFSSPYGLEPGKLHDARKMAICPLPATSWVPADGDEIDAYDPARDGLQLVEEMRRETYETRVGDPDSPKAHIIGGFAELATITREGATTEILRIWPDRVGEKIEPGLLPVAEAAAA